MTFELKSDKPLPGRREDKHLLRWQGTAVMGILNPTPDSFSDGGVYRQPEAALKRARALLAAGALILDVGGESTRPGAEAVPAELECDRVLPLIKRLRRESDAIVSIDTSKPEVAAAALRAGANLINDVTGLQHPEMLALAAAEGVPTVIMHMQGEPRTMQRKPTYSDVVAEVASFLGAQAERALQAGVPSVVLDPGIGFGKTLEHNLSLLRCLDSLVALGRPVLVGASRKRLIKDMVAKADLSNPIARDPGGLALHLWAAQQGAALVRVHEVAGQVQALEVWEALSG